MTQFMRNWLRCAILAAFSCSSVGCTSFGGTSLSDWWHNGLKVGPNGCNPNQATAASWRKSSYAGKTILETDNVSIKGYSKTLKQVDDANSSDDDPSVTFEEYQNDYATWWTSFDDPALTTLIETARQQNLDLKQAAFRVVRARALRDFAIGSYFPQKQQAAGGYLRSEKPGVNDNAAWSIAFSTSWEFDVWGKFRRAIESAEADLQGSNEDLRDVLICLYSDIGQTYVDIRSLQGRIKAAKNNIEGQESRKGEAIKRLNLLNKADEPPVFNSKDLDAQNQIVINQTLAAIADLEIKLVQAENKLAVLLGITPDQVSNLISEGNLPNPPSSVAIGIPADLICRRPDVRKAEQALASQCAKVGVAITDLYPSFSLIGSVGWGGVDVGEVFRARNLSASINPSFSWNILNYGRIRSNIDAEKAKLQELCKAYEAVVLAAHQEVEDAKIAYANSFKKREYFLRAAEWAQTALNEATNKGVGGVEEKLFNYQTALTSSLDSAVAAQAEISTNLIKLYKAIGGGWTCDDPIIDCNGCVLPNPYSDSGFSIEAPKKLRGFELQAPETFDYDGD